MFLKDYWVAKASEIFFGLSMHAASQSKKNLALTVHIKEQAVILQYHFRTI